MLSGTDLTANALERREQAEHETDRRNETSNQSFLMLDAN
jgi:hypothetical protein